jgi:hypothetical protein
MINDQCLIQVKITASRNDVRRTLRDPAGWLIYADEIVLL